MARTDEIHSQSSLSSGDSVCVINAGTFLEGQFTSEEQTRFDGHLVGDLTCGKRLIVGERGQIEGAVKARQIVILGRVKGDITAGEELFLRKGAVVTGKIHSPGINIEEGATFEGESRTKA